MFSIIYDDIEYEVDSFFECLVYRSIVDVKLDPIDNSILLFICRKTIGFQKTFDRLAVSYLCNEVGISQSTFKKRIARLISENLIHRTSSTGGHTYSASKYSEYRLGNKIIVPILENWYKIKEDNGFIR